MRVRSNFQGTAGIHVEPIHSMLSSRRRSVPLFSSSRRTFLLFLWRHKSGGARGGGGFERVALPNQLLHRCTGRPQRPLRRKPRRPSSFKTNIELNSAATAPTAVVLSLVLGTTMMMMMMLAFTASTASEAVSRGRLLLGGHCFQ